MEDRATTTPVAVGGAAAMPPRGIIDALVHEQVGPLLHIDGGEVVVGAVDPATGTVTLVYSAACAGCPGLGITHERLVAPLIRRAFPGIGSVRATIAGENPNGE